MCGIVKVFCFDLSKLNPHSENQLLSLLPPAEKKRIIKYINPLDRLQRVCGRIILMRILIDEGYDKRVLHYIKNDQYGRPYLNHSIDFNISHSGDKVVVAISRTSRLGVDVEKIELTDISDFHFAFTTDEVDTISRSENSINCFYEYWTIKEAVLKANGKGLQLPLSSILIKNDHVVCERDVWFVRKINIHAEYCCHLAFNGDPLIELINITPAFLFKAIA